MSIPNAQLQMPASPGTASDSQAAMLEALRNRQFFKLIGGGSLTEVDKIVHLSQIYAQAGVGCIDLAPDARLLNAVEVVWQALLNPKPVVMVSIPLDADPHFRKIELQAPDCIRCGLCLPVCPTEALTLPDVLQVSESLCYGCGRCVPVCPTDALHLLPFQVESQIAAALAHPLTEAVEIHSHYVDSYMLEAFLLRWKPWLVGKIISLCFRLESVSEAQMLAFYKTAQKHSELPVMLQIDGAPMSGNDDPEASRPALESAVLARQIFEKNELTVPPITISGGINAHTARLLQEPCYQFIAGVGMGTVARKAIWNLCGPEALQVGKRMVQAFQNRA